MIKEEIINAQISHNEKLVAFDKEMERLEREYNTKIKALDESECEI